MTHSEHAYTVHTPLGSMRARLAGDALRALSFGPDEEWVGARHAALEQALAHWFASGALPDELRLDPEGTALQRAVWHELSRIRRGVTISYAELAARVGRPEAVRAVASAVARNPVLLLIPCHRVIGTDGRLRGYAGGTERKRALLEIEGALTQDEAGA